MIPIYYIKKGNLNFADKVIFSDLEFYILPGDKICLIGKNGCGKSSLMKVVAGDYELDNGEIYKAPNIRIGYLRQDITLNMDITINDFILQATKESQLETAQYEIDMVLANLGIEGEMNLSQCSGGQIRRAYLAKALVSKPEILLLDEPTNHLDIAAIEWLEEYVKSYSGAIITISHDRAFLSNVTNKIWWLDRAVLRKSEKGFKYFDEWQEIILQQEEAILQKMNKKLDVENDWLHAGVTARRKRNQKRLAEVHNLRAAVKQHANKLSLAKQRVRMNEQEDVSLTKFIIEAENISFSYDRPIINNFSFRVKKGEKIGVIGANGSGKSTFIKLLTKQLAPSTGKVIHGTNLEISYFDQHRIELNPTRTLQQFLCETGGDQIELPSSTMHVAAYLKQFMFDPNLLSAKISTLSGGEASRLLLAKTLVNPGNLLILDEPTNDLDMDSLELLLEILADYKGTLLVVSHDRDFLDRLVTRTLIFAQNEIVDVAGGYEDYQQLKGPKIAIKAAVKTSVKVGKGSSNTEELEPQQPIKKLSYKHQRFLETVEAEVAALEDKMQKLELALADSNLYLTDQAKFTKMSEDLSQAKQKLDEVMMQWLEIEEMQKNFR